MKTRIFNISNNVEGVNGKWYKKESLYNELPEQVNVLEQSTGIELGVKTREEFISLLEESSAMYGFTPVDFGEFKEFASVWGWDKCWTYIYSSELF